MKQQRSWWLLTLVMLVLTTVLVACGGGGGSSSSSTTDGTTTGSVAILVTDAPSDDFARIEVTVVAVSLIDDEENLIEIWSSDSGKTIDLLSLDTESELFALATDVPVGWYDKIRLTIDSVELVDDLEARTAVDLPASGKIDLNPRGRFYVSADETLSVQLDLDANKSIHLVNANHYVLRPVVFVDILTAADAGRLVRLPGTVVSVDTDNGTFVLQQLGMTSQVAGDENEDDSVLVSLGTDGVIFGPDGLPMALADLTVDSPVVAVGFFAEGGDETTPQFDAVVVEVGDYTKLRGTVTVAPGTDGDSLTVIDEADQLVAVSLDAATPFYDCLGQPISRGDITVGQKLAIDVVVVADVTYAAQVVTCPGDSDSLSGTISVVSESSISLTTDSGEQCAEAAEDAVYYLLGEDTLTEITRAELLAGDTVMLFGEAADIEGDCFIYTQLFVEE